MYHNKSRNGTGRRECGLSTAVCRVIDAVTEFADGEFARQYDEVGGPRPETNLTRLIVDRRLHGLV